MVEPWKASGGSPSPGSPRPGTIQMSWTARPPSTQPKSSSPAIAAGSPSGPLPDHRSCQEPTKRPNSMSLSACGPAGPGTCSASTRPSRFTSPLATRQWCHAPDELVGEEGEAVTNRPGIDQAHRLPLAGLAEQALALPEDDGEDDQPQLVDEVVLDQRAAELIAGGDDDVAGDLALEPRD